SQAKEAGTCPPAHRFNPDVPERFDLIITKMAAKLPKYRHQSAAEVVNGLTALCMANDELEFLKRPSAGGEAAVSGPASVPEEDSSFPPANTIEKVLDPNLWWVRTKNAEGQPVLRQMTPSHIQKLLQT